MWSWLGKGSCHPALWLRVHGDDSTPWSDSVPASLPLVYLGRARPCRRGRRLGTGTPAHADSLTIDPTFDPSIASVSGAEGAINAAIAAVEHAVSSPNNITVSIYFSNGGGLGESITGQYGVSYYDYYNAYKAVATSSTS